MTQYINLRNSPKEIWLQENGIVTKEPSSISEDSLPVCLVDNGPFTAAGVCEHLRDVESFSQPHDLRHKIWYKVSREALKSVGIIL